MAVQVVSKLGDAFVFGAKVGRDGALGIGGPELVQGGVMSPPPSSSKTIVKTHSYASHGSGPSEHFDRAGSTSKTFF